MSHVMLLIAVSAILAFARRFDVEFMSLRRPLLVMVGGRCRLPLAQCRLPVACQRLIWSLSVQVM